MSAYFITSVGTDIGKTFLTCALISRFRNMNRDVEAFKPIISGFSEDDIVSSDTGRILAALERPFNMNEVQTLSPWRYKAPLSPHLAAARVGDEIKFDALIKWCENTMKKHAGKTVLFEGVGGVMVPLNQTHTVLDWIKALRIPVIVVTGSYLGAISHTLTALEVLKMANITMHSVVVSESENTSVTLDEMRDSIKLFYPEKIPVHVMARMKSVDDAAKILPDELIQSLTVIVP